MKYLNVCVQVVVGEVHFSVAAHPAGKASFSDSACLLGVQAVFRALTRLRAATIKEPEASEMSCKMFVWRTRDSQPKAGKVKLGA